MKKLVKVLYGKDPILAKKVEKIEAANVENVETAVKKTAMPRAVVKQLVDTYVTVLKKKTDVELSNSHKKELKNIAERVVEKTVNDALTKFKSSLQVLLKRSNVWVQLKIKGDKK